MVPVCCISRSLGLKIDFGNENLSETTRPRVLIFGMEHHRVDIYQLCLNYAAGQKMATPRVSPVLHRLL